MVYLANDKFSTTLSSGYTVGDSSLSVVAVPTNVPTIVVAAKGTVNETVFSVTGSSGGNTLTGVSRLRGANVNFVAGTSLTILNNEDFINQYSTNPVDALSIGEIMYGADSASDDDYLVALSPAVTTYSAGLIVAFNPNTSNTGPATISLNSMAAKAIKKNGIEDVVTGDIISGKICLLFYDGANFQLVSNYDSPLVTITAAGLVPTAPNDVNKYLRGDGTWAVVQGGLNVFATLYSAGNIMVLPDITAPYIAHEDITLATVKLFLKDGYNSGATATIVPKRNGKNLFTSAPTIAAPTQKDACDATTGWAGTGVTAANDTSIKKEGSGSLKLTVDATPNRSVDKTFSSLDASSPKAISFWIGANAAQTCRFYITDGTNTSYFNLDNVPLVAAGNLNFVRVYLTSQKLDNPDSTSGTKANIAAITHMGFDSLPASAIFYVDDIELENYFTGTPDITDIKAGDILSVDVTVVGSTLAGAGLLAQFIKS